MGILDPGGKEKMGWVNGAGALNPDAIKGDLAGLESGTKTEFDGNIDKCAGWNGDFGSRRKREAGETETEEEASNVPSVMESGSSALGWLKAAVRKTRSAEPGNGKKKSRKKGGKGGRKGGNRPKKRGNKTKKGRRNGNEDPKGKTREKPTEVGTKIVKEKGKTREVPTEVGREIVKEKGKTKILIKERGIKEKEMGRNLPQRREAKKVDNQIKDRKGAIRKREETMLWQTQLTTSFGVLISHWNRFWKNVWKIR